MQANKFEKNLQLDPSKYSISQGGTKLYSVLFSKKQKRKKPKKKKAKKECCLNFKQHFKPQLL